MVEVQAPYGYVLDSTPIPFTVAQENSTEESGVTIVVTEQKNMPQKGRILVSKTAEEFAGVKTSGDSVVDKAGDLTEGGNIYTPVFEVAGKAGAVYEIIAAEDIITQDGTVRASAGEVVDTISVMSVTHLVSGSPDIKSRFNRSSDFRASRSAFVIPFGFRRG